MNEQLRVLILEDDEIDAELMERELRKANIAFLSKRVGTGEAFQKELRDFSPDIILADYTLPAFDGCSALRIVKQRCPNTPFIFVSGTIGEDFAIESLKNGATDYVIKDRISRLAPAVLRALSEVKERDECMRAERALRESEMRFRSLVESAHDAIILTDGSGNIISCNKSAQTIFGYTEGEMVGKSILDIMPDRHRNDHKQRMEHVSLNDKPGINGKTIESSGLREDGSEIPLEISIATWRIEGKTFFSAIMRDITERKKAEEELLKLKLGIERSDEAMFITNIDGTIIYINPAFEKIYGFGREEALGKTPRILKSGLLPSEAYKPFWDTLLAKKVVTGELVNKTKDGRLLNIEGSANPIQNDQGDIIGFLAIQRDITGRKQAEKEKDRLLKAIDSSTEGITIADEKDRYIYVNAAYAMIYGYPQEELIGNTWRKITPPEVIAPIEKELTDTMYNRNIGMFSSEAPGLRKDGTSIPTEVRGTALWDENGSYQGHICIVRDVTERKRIEEELKIKAQLLDDSTDSVFVHDLDGNFIYLNESAYKSRGFDKGEMMGMNLHELVIPAYERLLEPRFKMLIEKGEGTFESAHFRKDGSVIPVEAHASIIESGGKKLVLSIIRDITERKRAEQALQYRLDFEKLITSISTNFINITSDKIDDEINHALAIIGEFTDVDRSYVLLVLEGGTKTEVTHEWSTSTIGSQLQELREFPFESSPWFAEKMKNLETIYIPRFADLPAEAGIELSKYQNTPIRSIIVAPIVYGGVLFGYLGLTSVRKEITLAEDLISLLKIVGEIFVNALVRKMAEKAVWESEARFRAIFEKAAIGMVLLNTEGRPIVSNPALHEMLGFTGEELRMMLFTEITHPDDIPVDKNMFKDLMAGKRDNYQIEKRYIRKDGRKFWGRLTVSSVRGDNGEPQFGIGMVEDITERKQAEELLKEKARAELYGFIVSALPVFAAGVPSQVRNTLVKNFGERFEKNIMPRFEEEMRRYGRDRRGAAADIRQEELDFFISWLTGMFSNLGIRARTEPKSTGRVFELLNCPWKGEASGNPIFCFICRTIMRRSLTWMPFKGSTEQRSSIANGSQVCGFEIHVK